MNALGLVEQESGRAVGFYCGQCGRAQLPFHCHEAPTIEALTELHRKADLCCTTSSCEKHDRVLYGWHLCQLCVAEGPQTDSKSVANYTESMPATRFSESELASIYEEARQKPMVLFSATRKRGAQ